MPKFSKTYSLIIYDWDGTLSDSCGQIVQAVQIAAEMLGQAVPAAEKIRSGIGLSFPEQAEFLFGRGCQVTQFRKAFEHAYYTKVVLAEPKLFEGVMPLLQWATDQGKAQAIATGKTRSGLDDALKYHQIEPFFAATVCADEAASKPSADMLLKICSQLQVDIDDALMVGDTTNDARAAEACGMDFVAVLTGGQTLSASLAKLPSIAMIDDIRVLQAMLSS